MQRCERADRQSQNHHMPLRAPAPPHATLRYRAADRYRRIEPQRRVIAGKEPAARQRDVRPFVRWNVKQRSHSAALISPSPRVRGEASAEASSRLAGHSGRASARAGIHNHRPKQKNSGTPGLWIPGSRFAPARDGGARQYRSRGALCVRALLNDHHDEEFFKTASLTHDPRKVASGFRTRIMRTKKGKAERREAHCSANVRA